MKRYVYVVLGVSLLAVVLVWETLFGEVDGPVFRTHALVQGDIVTMVTAAGTVNPVVTVKVSSQLSGQIAELFADYNQVVSKGQPLARLDAQGFEATMREASALLEVAQADTLSQQAALERAEAELANARAARVASEARAAAARSRYAALDRELTRKRSLPQADAISRSEVGNAQAERDSALSLLQAAEADQQVAEAGIRSAQAAVRMAAAKLETAGAVVRQRQASLDHARVELERTVIRAPIAGIVIRRDVDVGQTVAASLQAPTLFTIAQDLSSVKVETSIDEADIGRIDIGQHALFGVDAYPGREFQGVVDQIRKSPEVFQNVVTYIVVIAAANPDERLLPGMTATVRVVVGTASDVVLLPNAALRFAPPGQSPAPPAGGAGTADGPGRRARVWVLGPGGEPEPVEVRIGAGDERSVELLGGPLGEGSSVIVGTATAA